MEARDLPAVVDAFAPDAVVHSPFTHKLAFTGHQQIGAILEVVLNTFPDLRYTDEFVRGEAAVLVGRASIAGKELEFVDHMRLDQHGKITEFTVFFRPLPATTAALGAIGAGLAARKSRARSALVAALARPLAFLTAAGDGIGVRLVRSGL
jgi:hypothetical protein